METGHGPHAAQADRLGNHGLGYSILESSDELSPTSWPQLVPQLKYLTLSLFPTEPARSSKFGLYEVKISPYGCAVVESSPLATGEPVDTSSYCYTWRLAEDQGLSPAAHSGHSPFLGHPATLLALA